MSESIKDYLAAVGIDSLEISFTEQGPDPYNLAWDKWYRGDMDGKKPDPVNHPLHYKQFGVEVIDIIRHVLGPDGFRAYCIGNELKYRLRAGDKGDAAQDLAKAMKYREFREGK